MKIESTGQALWRFFRHILLIIFPTLLITAFACWLGNWRNLSGFGSGLFYAGILLIFLGWFVFRGNESLFGAQLDPLSPMKSQLPGTLLERNRQYWLGFMEGFDATATMGLAGLLCIGLGWLLISLAG